MKILIADDEAPARTRLAALLAANGCTGEVSVAAASALRARAPRLPGSEIPATTRASASAASTNTSSRKMITIRRVARPSTKPGPQGWSFMPSITSCIARLLPPVDQSA